MGGREIERKFLLGDRSRVPPLGEGSRLRQGYVDTSGDVEVRIRISDAGAVLTMKGGSGLDRAEVEIDVDRDQAELVWALTEGRRIDKVRHRIDLPAGLVAEVDVYEGELAGLEVVEVELPDLVTAEAFTPPPWFGRELTGDPAWSNASLARHGRPARWNS